MVSLAAQFGGRRRSREEDPESRSEYPALSQNFREKQEIEATKGKIASAGTGSLAASEQLSVKSAALLMGLMATLAEAREP